MKSQPKISVVMTVFNAEQYLREAMDSILGQSFADFEFIIVDNKSTDGSVEIIKSYSDERIRLIENAVNVGQTKALNIGIEHSRAFLIARMDADDISFPQRFQVQYDFLNKHPDIAVVGSFRIDIDQNGKQLRVFKGPADPIRLRCCLAGSGDLTYWCLSHPTVMIRKEVLGAVGFYREPADSPFGFPQDYDLWSRLIVKGVKFANIGEPLLKYRIVPRSESRNDMARLLAHRLRITQTKIKSVLPDLKSEDVLSLSQMLEFQLVEPSRKLQNIYGLFDKYFDAFMAEQRDLGLVRDLRERMKFYYLPVVFSKDKKQGMVRFFDFIVRRPSFLLDFKFYCKFLKVNML